METLLERVLKDYANSHAKCVANQSEFQLGSDHGWSAGSALIGAGYQLLGSGAYATVLSHSMYPGKVVKIYTSRCSSTVWDLEKRIEHAAPNPYNNLTNFIWEAMVRTKKFDPKVDSMASFVYHNKEARCVALFIVMEELRGLEQVANFEPAKRFINCLHDSLPERFTQVQFNKNNVQSYREFIKSTKNGTHVPKDIKEYRKFVYRQSFKDDWGITIDITLHNVMFRDGHPVITDPYF